MNEKPARKAMAEEQPIGRQRAKALTLEDLRHKIELDPSKGEFGPSLQLVLRTPEKKLVAIHHFRVPKLNRNKGEYFHGLSYPWTDEDFRGKNAGTRAAGLVDGVFQEFANRSKIKLTWEVKVADEICRRLAANVGMAKVETMLGMDTYAKTFAPGTPVELSEEQEKAVLFLLKHAEKPKEPVQPIWKDKPAPGRQGLMPRRQR